MCFVKDAVIQQAEVVQIADSAIDRAAIDHAASDTVIEQAEVAQIADAADTVLEADVVLILAFVDTETKVAHC